MKILNTDWYKKTPRPIQIMQFGEGNFLRCFIEWIIQKMNHSEVFSSDVVVVQPLEFGRVGEIAAQGGLYTTVLEGLNQGVAVSEKEVIDCLGDFINPYTQYQKFLDYAKSADLKYIISNTTEAGIVYDASDVDFTKTPKTYPGKLLALLKARYDYFKGSKTSGLHIIPCELIDYNGTVLKDVLVKLALTKGFNKEFIDWLTTSNYYYNTLVDRIVPGYPKDEITKLQEELGYVDNSIVKGEYFHLWVIEDHHGLMEHFPADKALLNVKFVEDFVPYKQRKVKILNGSHTFMTPISYLYGIDTVGETLEDKNMLKLIKHFIYEEVVPTIDLPREDMHSFAASVLERFQNPFVHHQLMSIALNSITKYKTRVLPTVLDNVALNKFPKCSLFSLAALIVFYFGKRHGEDIALVDNQEFLDLFKNLSSSYDGTYQSIREIVTEVLSYKSHWEVDLTKDKAILNYVTNCTYTILTKGMKEAVEVLCEELNQ